MRVTQFKPIYFLTDQEQTPSKDEPNQKQAGDVRRVSVSQKPDFSDSVSNVSSIFLLERYVL